MRKLSNPELNRPDINRYKKINKIPVIIVLDNIRSHNNIGSVFRTADAFLINSIYLCGITPVPPHRDIHKTALGAELSVEWKYFTNTLDAINNLKQNNYKILLVEQIEPKTYLNNFVYDSNQKYAFVFGNEVGGISNNILDIADSAIEIPQFGTKHSLNISITVSIVIWDYFIKNSQIYPQL